MMTAQAQMQASPKKLVLIDGYGFVFRAYHSMPPLTSPDGMPVGAVFGFTNMITKLIAAHDADYMALILDAGSKTFRNEIYSDYKANRPPAPEDLIPQFPLIRKVAEAVNIPAVEMQGYEADDLIATYALQAQSLGYEVMIVSSDKDLMQLVGGGIYLFDPMKSRKIEEDQVMEKFGVAPDKVGDVLALMGDASDNVPGVPGIGPKTAAELINQFGDLESVLENASNIKQNKRRQMLIEHAEQARLSRQLVALHHEVKAPVALDDMAVKDLDEDNLMAFAVEYGFKSIVSKLEKQGIEKKTMPQSTQTSKTVETHYQLCTDAKQLKQWLKLYDEIAKLAITWEQDKNLECVGLSLAVDVGRACYLPLESKSTTQDSLFGDEAKGDSENLYDTALQVLSPYVYDDSIAKISDNSKQLLKQFPDRLRNVDDVSQTSYLLNAGAHGHDLADMAVAYLGEDASQFKVKLADLDEEALRNYGSSKADMVLRLHRILKQDLVKQRLVTFYERIEKPLASVLADMERKGIKVDPVTLKDMSADFEKRMAQLVTEIHSLAGREFNVGSPKQLGEVLYDDLGIEGGKKSKKTGAYSTGAEVLEELEAKGYDIAGKVLQWRQLSKLKSTYTDALGNQIAKDGRIHTHFSMHATSTGRLSSHNPNLQNIPIRSEEGNKIRAAFIPEKGKKLIAADYSQIELRLLADMADIDILRQAFINGDDIHAATASQMFGVPLDEVNSDLRRKAKMINFGIIYGISAFGLARRLGIERSEASDYIKQYFKQYPGIEAYMETTKAFAHEHGYVLTKWGRKCHVKDINSKNPTLRQFSERAAINAPLQGSAADIIKKAMVALPPSLKAKQLDADILLQVHDELVIEVPESQADEVAHLVKKVMEAVGNLSLPLTVDVGVGNSWQEIH